MVFQHFEIDYHETQLYDEIRGEYEVDTYKDKAPTLIVYGVTKEGDSIACFVHGFKKYFYLSVPQTFNKAHCELSKNLINEALSVRKIKLQVILRSKINRIIDYVFLIIT